MMRRFSLTRHWPYLLTALIALAIAWGTLSPPGDGPGLIKLNDKQIHALAFALLILPTALTNWPSALRLAPICLGYGAMIELIQPGFGRSGEWADLAADGVGLLIGITLAWTLRRVFVKGATTG